MCEVAEKIYTQGIEQGIEQSDRRTAYRMYKKGVKVAEIAEMLNRSEQQIEDWLGMDFI